MEELLARHRKEIRDLTSRTTQKKKLATKKTRKGVISECEALERDLELKQAREVSELTDPESLIHDNHDEQDGQAADVDADADMNAILQTLSIADQKSAAATATAATTTTANTNTTPPESTTSKKPSRQKARLARRAADLAALSAAAEAEAASLPDLRSLEIAAMQNRLSTLKLTENFITPDGHCLYSAFADQVLCSVPSLLLPSEDVLDYKLARRKCADYMVSHRADFEPFLEDAFDEHVRKVGETAEWGGQTEVLALAKVFGVVANVVQAEGRGVEKMNDGGTNGEVWLGYYRHSFGLGEHYNSLRRKE